MLDKPATSYDVNFDAEIDADKVWLQGHMDAFWDEAAKEYPTAFAARNARRAFNKFVSSNVFGENTVGTPVRKTSPYNYNQFSIKKPVPEMLTEIPEEKNLLSLWQSYLNNVDTDNIPSRNWVTSHLKEVISGMKSAPMTTYKLKVGHNSQRFLQYEEALQKNATGEKQFLPNANDNIVLAALHGPSAVSPVETVPQKATGTALAWIIGPHPETPQTDPLWLAELKEQKFPKQENFLLAALNDNPAAAHVAECAKCTTTVWYKPNPARPIVEAGFVSRWDTDQSWLYRRISDFSHFVEEKAIAAGISGNETAVFNKIYDMQNYLARVVFQSPIDLVLTGSKTTRFTDFDVETEGGKINLLGLYRDYTKGLSDAVTTSQKWIDGFVTNYIGSLEQNPTLGHKFSAQARQLIHADHLRAKGETVPTPEAKGAHTFEITETNTAIETKTDIPEVTTAIDGAEEPRAVQQSEHNPPADPQNDGPVHNTYPFYWRSNAVAAVAGLAGSVFYHREVISLLEGVSRVALNSALNGTGYAIFGMIAGAAAGTATTIVSNFYGSYLAAKEAPRGDKIKAFFNAVAESCSRGQIITNAVTGGLAGLAFGGIDAITDGISSALNGGEAPLPETIADVTPTPAVQPDTTGQAATVETPVPAQTETTQIDTQAVTVEATPEDAVTDTTAVSENAENAQIPDADAPSDNITLDAGRTSQANTLSQEGNTAAPSVQVEDNAAASPGKAKEEPVTQTVAETAVTSEDAAPQASQTQTQEEISVAQPAVQPQTQAPTPAQEVLPETTAAPNVATPSAAQSAVMVPAADTETVSLSSMTEDFKQTFRFETHADLGTNVAHASDLDIALNPVATDSPASLATPPAPSVTVKSGDTAIGIVMEAFNLTSETADMNGDGKSDLDQILREVQIANGMENANQLNWIRPGDTLDLPAVDLGTATETVDRASMDEGVRTRNVDFAPKFAA